MRAHSFSLSQVYRLFRFEHDLGHGLLDRSFFDLSFSTVALGLNGVALVHGHARLVGFLLVGRLGEVQKVQGVV